MNKKEELVEVCGGVLAETLEETEKEFAKNAEKKA